MHVVVDEDSMPLSITIGPGDGYDSKRLVELVGRLWEKPRIYWCRT